MRLFALLLSVCILSCGGGKNDTPYKDQVDTVPKGDPAFTRLPLEGPWIVDNAKILTDDVIRRGDRIIQDLDDDKIAEVVLIIQPGVKHPEEWATHYLRWLDLGEKGLATKGGSNGIVILIRPDADEKVTINPGIGLPWLTSADYGPIIDKGSEYLNFGNWNDGVLVLLEGLDKKLRELSEGR